MAIDDTDNKGRLGVLVHGPKAGDAQFYGKWLLAVSTLKMLWHEVMGDPDFENRWIG